MVKSLPKETRGEIVSLLKKSDGMTAGEIATKLDLHSMTVRQHLTVLEREGYIQYNREKIGRGRPTYVYRLAEEAARLFPSNYPRFTMGILDALVMVDGAEKVDQILAYDMEAKISTHFKNIEEKSLERRVEMLVDFLNEEGYMVEVEETPTAFIMKEHNCALGSVVEKYNQLCQQELSLFERLLSVPVERQCHMVTGDHLCSYKISKVGNA
ncbi:MAG: transcriptional regulator [Candidatus Poribacteria bacterium]|nr:transcriptional regulator [Candidatus Poribacteria bacterium]